MKKFLQSVLSVFLALVLFSAQSMAYTITSNASSETEVEAVSDFNEDEIYAAFNEVDKLVATIEQNEEVSYSDLEATNSELVSNISSNAAIAMNASTADTPPFVSAFLWGCIFNWVGMLIVGITTDFDGTQLKKSAWGCLINSLLFSGGYLVY
jgi:hypothetical protein